MAAMEDPSIRDPSVAGRRDPLLTGPVLPAVLRLAAPVTFAMALHTAFQVVDLAWVGRLGAAASGAVSICFYASWLLYAISEAIGIGIVAQVSRAVGARKLAQAGHVAAQGTLLALLVGLGLALSAPIFVRLLFRILGTPEEVTRLGVIYFEIFLIGGPPLLLMIAIESVFRAAGDTVTPMWVMGSATVLNIAIDPPLIFGWGSIPALGVAGAAWASVISWTLAVVAFIVVARRRPEHFPFRGRSLRRIDRLAFRNTIRIGVPRFLLGGLFSTVYLFLSGVTARLGTGAIAVLGIVNRIESVVYLVSDGIGVATATMVGQNLGARQPERAERATWVASSAAVALSLVPTIAMLALPEALLRIFTPDAEVIALGAHYVWILAWCQVFMAVEIVVANAFAGAGDTMPPMIVELPISGMRMPLAWLAGLRLDGGLNGIGWVLSLTCIARGVWLALWFRGGRWKRRSWEGAA